MCSSDCYVPIFNVYWLLYGLFGITFQLILIYLISQKSPATLDNLKCFLYNTSFVQIALILFAFSSQHRTLSNRTTLAILPLGPCHYVSPVFCFVIYHIYMAISLAAGSAISITVLFRFLVLVRNQVTPMQTYIMVAASYIAPTILLILPFTAPWDFHSVYNATALEHRSYDLSLYFPYPGFADVGNFQFLSATLILFVGAYGIPLGCLLLTRKVLTLIRYHQHMSDRTKKQAKTLIYGLIVQSMLPVISYIPTFSCYLYTQSTGHEILISEHLILASSSFPGLVDPWISFYFIVPYRQAILDVILPKQRRARAITSVTNNSISGVN
ncbi:unnamed protein product [Caenorhabditis sp. 36 PRJEB53466]|nr:unnamed protein product [Caenorhabditis sp. 36 PRJEB53466]